MTFSEIRSVTYEFILTLDRFDITSPVASNILYVDEDKLFKVLYNIYGENDECL